MKPLPVLLLIAASSSASLVPTFRSTSSEVASHTTPWADTSRRGDTTFYSSGRVITTIAVETDSQWTVQPRVTLGLPSGPYDVPPDSLCTLGYTGTTLPVFASTVARDLQRTRECGARTFAKIRQVKLRDSYGQLSVSAALAELATWPWAEVCSRVKDSTIMGFFIGDDVTAKDWGPAPFPTRLAQWDTIAGLVQAQCPGAPTVIRALPTQLEKRPHWQWLTTAWAQYPGPRPAWGPPEKFFGSQVASAKKQRLGLVAGVNLLNGGCGPAARRLCLPDLPGTTLPGTKPNLYQLSAAELIYYKTVAMNDPYVCASIDWGWGPKVEGDFHNRPEIRSAQKVLSVLARSRPVASCVVGGR